MTQLRPKQPINESASMERIFKIKTKSPPDLTNQYPSERRYSSSIVLGLSVVLLQLSVCSVLMGGLIVHKMSLFDHTREKTDNETEQSLKRLSEKLGRDLDYNDQTYLHYYINIPALITAGCFLMSFGDILAFITGIFAWNRWYIDNNITFFFLTCSFSTLTASISLLISVLTSVNIRFDQLDEYEAGNQDFFPLSLPLAVNIIVLSFFNLLWCFVATKIAYKGMKNSYPDDVMVKRGRIEVSTIKKGNQNSMNNIPIEVINNFTLGKMAKYLPKKENNDLPKPESNAEYEQRVNKFLSAQADNENNEEKSGKVEDKDEESKDDKKEVKE